MSVQVTLTFTSLDAAIEAMNKINPEAQAPSQVVKVKPVQKTQPPTVSEQPASDAAPEAATPKTPVQAQPAPSVDYKQISDATVNLAKAKGREAAAAVLAKFGVAKAPALKPEDYSAYLTAVEQALAGEEVAA